MQRPAPFPPVAYFLFAIAVLGLNATSHATFVTGYSDGASWNTIYAQGFSPSAGATPDPGVASSTPVALDRFSFFKSGSSDSAANVRLAILDGLFADVTDLSIGVSPILGVSSNVIASTAPLAIGDPIAFEFDGLSLAYGGDYGAVLVTEGAGGVLTPVLVSALTANYVDDGTGTFRPESNYGTEDDFQYAVSNFISSNAFGQFFNVFSFAADANFQADFTVVPEPAGAVLVFAAIGLAARQRRYRLA